MGCARRRRDDCTSHFSICWRSFAFCSLPELTLRRHEAAGGGEPIHACFLGIYGVQLTVLGPCSIIHVHLPCTMLRHAGKACTCTRWPPCAPRPLRLCGETTNCPPAHIPLAALGSRRARATPTVPPFHCLTAHRSPPQSAGALSQSPGAVVLRLAGTACTWRQKSVCGRSTPSSEPRFHSSPHRG